MALFATTSWTVIARTREPGDESRRATAALCQQYWQPLYVFVRHHGQTAHEAEDTVQAFLMHVVEQDVFARAEADRGRFRTFLLASLRQFMARQHRDQSRLKRAPGDGASLLTLDVERAEVLHAAAGSDSPDNAFERAWAMTQLDLAWDRVEVEFGESNRGPMVTRLRAVISGRVATPMREIAEELGMSEGAVNVAAHRLRRRFGEVLRELIADTLQSPEEVDDEIGRLRAAMAVKPK